MKNFKPLSAAVILSVCLISAPASLQAAESKSSAQPSGTASVKGAKPDQALRIYLKTGAKKTYVRGYQWMTLDLNRKINLVESARRGALKMNAVMTFPAETYVREIDKFFAGNPSLMQMEVGQVIQGVAISIKDWNAGTTGA